MTLEQGSKEGGTAEDARVVRTRADVARAALDILTTEGWEAVTHAHVAEVAGYSKTTLYAHWPSKFDLIVMALGALDAMPHSERSGDMRADLIGELKVFRQGVIELRLDRVLFVMAQWASVDEMGRIRDKINADGQRVMYVMLGEYFAGPALEAAVSMLTGVVACPALMYGQLPDDDVIEAAVDIVLRGVGEA